jgi:glycine C-acetyltransferase
MLRQRSRPYLFSNTLPPAVVGSALEVIRILDTSSELRERLIRNTKQFRQRMTAAGFEIAGKDHPIVSYYFG